VLAERRMQQGQSAELGALMNDVLEPPVDRIGALDVIGYLSTEDRTNLAAALNTLLAPPTFTSWRRGASLDIREWLTAKNWRTPAIIVSVAHLEDDERALVLGVLLEEVLSYTRGLPVTRRLRLLIVFDECCGVPLVDCRVRIMMNRDATADPGYWGRPVKRVQSQDVERCLVHLYDFDERLAPRARTTARTCPRPCGRGISNRTHKACRTQTAVSDW
jgi:hypothetical protein